MASPALSTLITLKEGMTFWNETIKVRKQPMYAGLVSNGTVIVFELALPQRQKQSLE